MPAGRDPARIQPDETVRSVLVDQVERLTFELAASEDRFHATVMTSTDGVLIVNPRGSVRFANPAAAELLGFDSVHTLIDLDLGLPLGQEVIEIDLVRGNRTCITEMRTAATVWAGQRSTLALLRDMTERYESERALRESQERYALVAEASGDGIFDYDLADGTAFYSQRLCDLLGRSPTGLPQDLTGWIKLVDPEDHDTARSAVTQLLSGRITRSECQIRITGADGFERHILWRAQSLQRDGVPVRVAGAVMDVTRRVRAEERLKRLSLRDELTGLPNRRAVLEALTETLNHDQRKPHQRTGLLFCDLDGFKQVNDELGHAVGDLLLIEVGRRLKGAVRPYDTVSRLGGDEFVIVLHELNDEHEAMVIAQRVLESMAEAWEHGGRSRSISVSLGLKMAEPGAGPDELLTGADNAMYAAKRKGGQQFVLG